MDLLPVVLFPIDYKDVVVLVGAMAAAAEGAAWWSRSKMPISHLMASLECIPHVPHLASSPSSSSMAVLSSALHGCSLIPLVWEHCPPA
eukprot:750332-Hanusia_phi.AAC.4